MLVQFRGLDFPANRPCAECLVKHTKALPQSCEGSRVARGVISPWHTQRVGRCSGVHLWETFLVPRVPLPEHIDVLGIACPPAVGRAGILLA